MRKILLISVLLTFAFFANAQRIVKDSLLFSYTKAQLEALYTAQGIPPSLLDLKYGIKGYRVIYNTVNYDSSATIASGLMIFPDSVEYCQIPILSYQHGTTVRRKDVPSRLSGSEKLIVYAMSSAGMIGCMPDYHGMGDGLGYHPYQNARTEAYTVVDIIRAAKEKATAAGVAYSNELFLVGYSQGGHATMAAQKMIQEKLSNEMTVTASAPMSGAYDMSGVQTDLLLLEQPYSDPYYLPYLVFGNNPIYNFFTNPNEILRAPYDTALPPVMNGIASATTINSRMNDTVKRIFRQDMIDSFLANPNHFFRVFLRDNDVYEWVPQSPTKLFFCTADEKVPYQNSIKAFNYFKSHGAPDVDTVNGGALLHTDCAMPVLLSAKQWFTSLMTKPITTTPIVNPQVNNNLGSIKLQAVGGKAPLQISWSNGAQTDSIGGLAAGVYKYTLTDANGCSKTDSITVAFTNSIEQMMNTKIAVFPNPAKDFVRIVNTANESIKQVEVINILGETIELISATSNDFMPNTQNWQQGFYTLKITFNNNINIQKRIVKNNF